MALTKVTGGLISTTSNYEVGVITATKFVGPIEGGVTGITTGSDKIKVIDESSDTTCFPLFATHSDGYLAAKSGSNLLFNSNNGTLTATTFSGALTGNVNGNATGLSGTPSIVVQDITAEMVSVAGTMQYEDVVNVDATGIVTAGGGLVVPANKVVTITGDLNVDGKTDLDDLSVAGVSTFADDVNLQGANAGITSVTWDKSANSLIFKDNSKAVFGTGSDVSMYNATNFHIEKTGTDGSGIRIHVPTDESIEFQQAQATVMATFTANGSCSLYNNTVKRIETSSTGVTVTGEVAASQDYPNYRPTLDLNFAAVKKLDSRFTYERTGPASYIDEFGIVKLVSDNIPRFDHDPATRESKGLLIELSRTNDWAYSTDISKVTAQGSFAGTQTFNTTTAPDGTTTADSHKGSGSSGRHSLYWEPQLYSSAQLDNSSVYTFSVFVKQITGNSAERYCELETAQHSTWTNAGGSPTFDLQNGTMDTGNASSGITGTIESYPDGWYRISITSTTGTTTNDTGFYFNHTSSDGNSSQTLATTEGFHFWGAQIEKGSYTTSYIPTYGTTVTRGAEIVTIEGEEFTDFYNQIEGTLVLSASYIGDIRGSAIVVIDDTSNESEYTEVGYRSGGGGSGAVASYIRTDAGNDQYYKQYASSATQGNEFKVALAYKDDDYASSVNGQTVDTDTSGTTSKVYDRLRFSDVDTVGVQGAGYYRRFIYYPKRLPDNQVVTLTS